VPDVFAERPVIVFGKWRGAPRGALTIEGITGAGPYRQQLDLATVEPLVEHAALRQLWARSRIATLSDYGRLGFDTDSAREVTQLGLKYSLLTAYTSFVAVDQVVRNREPGALDSVDQPSPPPQGVSDLAVGGEVPGTPEPETWALLAVALGVLVWLKRSGRLHA
jgi:Ca-activated chloride channel family protein